MVDIISSFIDALGTAVINIVPVKSIDMCIAILFAILLIAIGYVVAGIVGEIVVLLARKMQFDQFMKDQKLHNALRGFTLSGLLGAIVTWWIFIMFLVEAVSLKGLGLGVLSTNLQRFVLWLPDVITGVVIIIAGLIIAGYVSDRIKEMNFTTSRILATIVDWVIILMVVVMALDQIGIENTAIIKDTFITLVQALAIAFALGIGLAIGLGAKDTVAKISKENEKRIRKTLGL